jgi:hypothetical protein
LTRNRARQFNQVLYKSNRGRPVHSRAGGRPGAHPRDARLGLLHGQCCVRASCGDGETAPRGRLQAACRVPFGRRGWFPAAVRGSKWRRTWFLSVARVVSDGDARASRRLAAASEGTWPPGGSAGSRKNSASYRRERSKFMASDGAARTWLTATKQGRG